MGAECSCSNLKISGQDQILHDIDPAIQEKTLEKTATEDILKGCDIEKEDREQKNVIAVADQDQEEEQNHESEQLLAEKSVRKKQKKVVQVMVPKGQKEENSDQVTFIQKQVNRSQKALIAKTLKNHFILSQLSSDEINYVVHKMKCCKATKGDFIFKQGNPSFSYYVIIEGRCSVHIDGEVKKYLDSGTSFGDLGIIYNAPRSASIFAETDCVLAELNARTFRRILNDLNSIYEQENKKILETLDFYKNLSDDQKYALASNCIAETYQAGQMIFNKGDAANAFYVVQQGIVTLVQKNLDLKAGQNVGVNAILGNATAVRSCSLMAKTNSRLISLTREILMKNLGENINHVFRRNLVLKILKESDIWEMCSEKEWFSISQQMQFKTLSKGDIVFEKGNKISPYALHIILKADARSKTNPKANFYIANSIIEPNKVFKKQQFTFEDEFHCDNEAQLVKLTMPNRQKQKEKQKHKKQDGKKGKNELNSSILQSQSSSILRSGKKQKLNLNMKDFIVLRVLRSGNFGKVYACYNKVLKKKLAIKVMNKQTLIASNVLSYIQKQTELMESIPQHPFLIKYFDTFQSQNLIMIVMELIQGEDMFDAVNAKLPLKVKDLRLIAAELVTVIEHLHANKVIYRDLKPENVMLNFDGHVTLVDLGTAKKLSLESRFKTSTIIGTPHYMAPEILLGKGYTFIADWWSLGVMMYEMATGKLPYGQNLEDPFAVYQQIIKNELTLISVTNTEAREVIDKLLTKNMFKRMKNGSTELKGMTFFRQLDWEKVLRKEYEAKVLPAKTSSISTEEIEKMLGKKKLQPALQIFLKNRETKDC